ncbi:MAG: AAA family ATPase [Methanomassiliicoccales archaeon]
MRITISGPPGSGKTTVCRQLAEKLSLNYIVAGSIFRKMASERGVSLEDFGKIASEDSSIDRMLDEEILKIARENDHIILEGRLTGYLMHKNGIDAFKIYLDADFEERARRASKRDGIDLAEARASIAERERCELKRYEQYYGFSPEDRNFYDFVIDTTSLSPDEVVSRILRAMEEKGCRKY